MVTQRLSLLPLTSRGRLDSLEETIIERNVKFVLIDSIAAIARREFDSKSLHHRQVSLGKQAAHLKRLAENFQIPILVTNQVTTSRSGRASYSFHNRTSTTHLVHQRGAK
jgi:RecA/RadA recombinase